MTQPETAVPGQATDERPGTIHAVPLRRPGRVVAGAVMLLIGIWIIYQIITNPAFDWAFTFEAMNQTQVIRGFVTGTLVATVGAMILGVVLGVVLAVMRMSDNPILRWSAGIYVWFFRAIHRYVLLMILGAAGAFALGGLSVGIWPVDGTWQVVKVDLNRFSTTIWMAIIGLGLSEAAYMAEIARSGILSVDRGQWEAARSLGLPYYKALVKVIMPQGIKIMVPSLVNQLIITLKDTSILSAIGVMELTQTGTVIIARNMEGFKMWLIIGVIYIIIITLLTWLSNYVQRKMA